jgi:hypothetical protein
LPGIAGGSWTFSWKAMIRPSASLSITPKDRASSLVTGIAATVTSASVWRCCAISWRMSIL